MDQGYVRAVRRELTAFLGFEPTDPKIMVDVRVEASATMDGYTRQYVRYPSRSGGIVSGFIFLPGTIDEQRDGGFQRPGIVVFHQHASQWHLGKSEIAGLEGDRWQAFGPALARAGFVVLAPDALGFEERRMSGELTRPHPNDWTEHYNNMAYRLLKGDSLMATVLSDAADALTVLSQHTLVCSQSLGLLGHSMGGNTVLFHAAVDERVSFAVSSGSAASFGAKMAAGTGIEMAEVLPGFCERFEVEDLLVAAAAIPYLVCSATEDPYSHDSDKVVAQAIRRGGSASPDGGLQSRHDEGGHALNQERFDAIVAWLQTQTGN